MTEEYARINDELRKRYSLSDKMDYWFSFVHPLVHDGVFPNPKKFDEVFGSKVKYTRVEHFHYVPDKIWAEHFLTGYGTDEYSTFLARAVARGWAKKMIDNINSDIENAKEHNTADPRKLLHDWYHGLNLNSDGNGKTSQSIGSDHIDRLIMKEFIEPFYRDRKIQLAKRPNDDLEALKVYITNKIDRDIERYLTEYPETPEEVLIHQYKVVIGYRIYETKDLLDPVRKIVRTGRQVNMLYYHKVRLKSNERNVNLAVLDWLEGLEQDPKVLFCAQDSESNVVISLRDKFAIDSEYDAMMSILAEKGCISQDTHLWIDRKKGNMRLLAAIIKHYRVQGYYKNNLKLSVQEIKSICENTFGWQIGNDTIKKADPELFDFDFIPVSSNFEKH